VILEKLEKKLKEMMKTLFFILKKEGKNKYIHYQQH